MRTTCCRCRTRASDRRRAAAHGGAALRALAARARSACSCPAQGVFNPDYVPVVYTQWRRGRPASARGGTRACCGATTRSRSNVTRGRRRRAVARRRASRARLGARGRPQRSARRPLRTRWAPATGGGAHPAAGAPTQLPCACVAVCRARLLAVHEGAEPGRGGVGLQNMVLHCIRRLMACMNTRIAGRTAAETARAGSWARGTGLAARTPPHGGCRRARSGRGAAAGCWCWAAASSCARWTRRAACSRCTSTCRRARARWP